MEVINQIPNLEEVINNNNLQISVIGIGNVTEGLQVEYPFDLVLNVPC